MTSSKVWVQKGCSCRLRNAIATVDGAPHAREHSPCCAAQFSFKTFEFELKLRFDLPELKPECQLKTLALDKLVCAQFSFKTFEF